MKKSIFAAFAALLIGLPAIASTPAGSYDEELRGRSKPTSQIRHQVEVSAGFITGGNLKTKLFGNVATNLSRPTLDIVYGARFNPYLFAGIGTGLQYAYGECNLIHHFDVGSPDKWGALGIPLYVNVKGYYPVSRLVAPYITLSIGHAFIATSNFSQEGYGKLNGGLYCKFGAGVTISNFTLSLGLASQSVEWVDASDKTMFRAGNNAFFIEAGVRF